MLGGSTTPERFCKIAVYVKSVAPDLYENIENVCGFSMLNPRRGRGVTFLLPDKSTQIIIDKLVGTDTIAAKNMINSCIVPMYIASPADFTSDIPDSNGNVIEVKSSTATGVTLKNGSKLSMDKKFKRLFDDAQISVMKLEGPVFIGTTPSETFNNLNKKKERTHGVQGGNDDGFVAKMRGGKAMNWIKMVELIKADSIAKSSIEYPLDPLSHAAMSFEVYLSKNKSALYEIMHKIKTLSPLGYLFVLGISGDVANQWFAADANNYDKPSTFEQQRGTAGNYYVELFKFVQIIIKKLAHEKARLNTDVVNAFKYQTDVLCRNTEFLKALKSVFKTKEQFVAWWIGLCEFSHLYTRDYITSYTSGNTAGVAKVFDQFIMYYQPHLISGNFKAMSRICEKDTVETERICAILGLITSCNFCAAGGSFGDIKSAVSATNGIILTSSMPVPGPTNSRIVYDESYEQFMDGQFK